MVWIYGTKRVWNTCWVCWWVWFRGQPRGWANHIYTIRYLWQKPSHFGTGRSTKNSNQAFAIIVYRAFMEVRERVFVYGVAHIVCSNEHFAGCDEDLFYVHIAFVYNRFHTFFSSDFLCIFVVLIVKIFSANRFGCVLIKCVIKNFAGIKCREKKNICL